MNAFVRFAQALGVSSIPLGGFFLGGWSPSTLLAVYWFENLFGSLLIAGRIAVHRKRTGKRGHYQEHAHVQVRTGRGKSRVSRSVRSSRRGGFAAIDQAARAAAERARRGRQLASAPGPVPAGGPAAAAVSEVEDGAPAAAPVPRAAPDPRGSPVFLKSFTVVSLGFNLVHGLFLALVLVLLLQMPPERSELESAVIGVAVFQVAAFLLDLRGLGGWPFAALRGMVDRSLGRVVLVQLSIIGGMALFAWWNEPRWFFGIFVVLKSLTDFGGVLPQIEVTERPPRWMARVIGLFGEHERADFERYWRESHAQDRRTAEEDEQIWDPRAGCWVSPKERAPAA